MFISMVLGRFSRKVRFFKSGKTIRFMTTFLRQEAGPYALGTRTLFWFGHGCSGNRMLSKHERYHGLGMDAVVAVCCQKHERYCGLGMDAVVTVSSRNTNVIMVWACMHW